MKSKKERWSKEVLLLDMVIKQTSSTERGFLLLDLMREQLIFHTPKGEEEDSVLEMTRGLPLRIYKI